MDWSTFTPTLIATFAGVFLSVILSLVVYKIRNWCRDKGQAKETKRALLEEFKANEETLKDHIEHVKRELKKGRRGLYLNILSRLETSVYDAACQGNLVRLVGDISLQRSLATLVENWRFFNLLLQRCEDIAILGMAHAPLGQAGELLRIWDGLVIQKAEEFLKETVEVGQKLETAEQRCCPQYHILKRYLSSFFSFTRK